MTTFVYVFAGLGALFVLGAMVVGIVMLVRRGGRGKAGGGRASGDEAVDFDAEYKKLADEADRKLAPEERGEAERLRKRFDQAMAKLRGSEIGRRALAQAPFYLLVGPSAAGKTQLVTSSGMFRPDDKTQGSGPTLSFVWWLSARAIAIDLAGRWSTTTPTLFLKVLAILKRLRPERPLNGILVVIPAGKFAPGARKDLRTLAEQMRDRVEEVRQTLQFQVPVYLLVSQCDRIGGFEELFHPLRASAVDRDKLLGFTLPSDPGRHSDPRSIEVECDKRMERLVRSLETYAVKRMREEWPRQESQPIADNEVVRATALSGFVPRFRRVAEGVNEFMTTLVGADIEAPTLRGVFFSSATQTEANVAGEMFSSIGRGTADVEKAAALPFFVRSLFAALLEGDAHLAHKSPEAEAAAARRSRKIALAVGGLAVAAAGALAVLNLRARDRLADIQMVVAATQRAGDGTRPPKRFDHAGEITEVVGSLADGVPLGVASEARDALVTTIRTSVVVPIVSAVRDNPALMARPCEHVRSMISLGAEAPPGVAAKTRAANAADFARLWVSALSGERASEPFVARAFEVYAGAAEKKPDLWGPPAPESTIDDCCKRLASASTSHDGPWELINQAYGKGTLSLPAGLILTDEKKALPLQYTSKAHAKFVDAANQQASAVAKIADPICTTAAASTSAEAQIQDYEENYTRAWTDFLQALKWKDPVSVAPTDLQSMIAELGAWRKDVEVVVSVGDRAKQLARKNLPIPGKVQALEKELPQSENRTLSGFLDCLDKGNALRDRLADLDKHAAEAAAAAPADRAKSSASLAADRDAGAALCKDYPDLVQQVFSTGEQRATIVETQNNRVKAHAAWCAFIGEYRKSFKRKYPFASGVDDAKPKELQDWLDKFSYKAFEKVVPASGQEALKKASDKLDLARRGLGDSLDGASAKYVKVTLGDTSEPTKLFALKWGGQDLQCKGKCLQGSATGRMRLPVQAISFEMRDAREAKVDLETTQWSSDFALVHLVETLGRRQVVVGRGSKDVTISARVDLEPTFQEAVEALRDLGKSLDALDRSASCDDVPK